MCVWMLCVLIGYDDGKRRVKSTLYTRLETVCLQGRGEIEKYSVWQSCATQRKERRKADLP